MSTDSKSSAHISAIGGPVLRAKVATGRFRLNEVVHIGPVGLLGEVLHIEQKTLYVQVYEETAGLRLGDPLTGTDKPLVIRLGPGLLGGIYDGLLRPLTDTNSVYVQPGIFTRRVQRFRFNPLVKAGDSVSGGSIFATATGGNGQEQSCLLPPDASGRILRVAGADTYAEDDTVCELEAASGNTRSLAMSHEWPVRIPRPNHKLLPLDAPLFTGQRIVDSMFPIARGGKAAMPGGFGTGKTILQQSLAKWCDADVIVYIGCGERGNEMTSVLHEFPQLEDPRSGKRLLERSIIIANTSNMPVAAREASIYTGVTVAEYFRDQGLNAALLADSTSRWAEALREISGRLGELPAEAGYPAYLASRKAEFYERAARVETLAGNQGSVTLIGAVSPPGGDFSEPVTLHTQRQVRCFWPLDRNRARARFFPAINPLQAYSEYTADIKGWWQSHGNPAWEEYRRRFLSLLEQEAHLERMARIVGKDALPPEQQLTLLCAGLVNDAFLRQNAFSLTDRYTSAEQQGRMMRLLVYFTDNAFLALQKGASLEEIAHLPVLRRLRRMGEDITADAAAASMAVLEQEIDTQLHQLQLEKIPMQQVEMQAK